MNFNHLGLKKLICTSYAGSPISHTELKDLPLFQDNEKMPYMMEITEVGDYNGDGAEDLADIEYLLRNNKNTLTILDGDGDFRSEECINFLKEADIVVTNPPFSISREYYIPQLMEYKKRFLIIGDLNWVTYKNIFPLIKDNKIWFGYNKVKEFYQPDKKTKKFGNKLWYTNLDIDKRHEDLILYKKYDKNYYPKYDNYDAIEVSKVAEIPYDYEGVMGVPITFLDKYNPEQFELVGCDGQGDLPLLKNYQHKEKVVDGVRMKSKTGTLGCVIKEDIYGKGTYFDVGYPVKAVYKRLFIRRRKNEN